jgi:hypothetical protein
VTLEAIEHTLKQCYVEHGRCDVAVSPLIVMQALYGAATSPN